MAIDRAQTKTTATEFYEIVEHSDERLELIDGEIIVMSTPLLLHQITVGLLYTLLNVLKPNGLVVFSPVEVYFDEKNIPQPDLVWVAEGSQCRITEKRLEGAPDLIVEVLSPSTATRDKTDKFALYEKYGVREYWIVDAANQYVEVWTLRDSKYAQHGIFGADSTFESPMLGGQKVELKAVFAN